MPRSLVENFDLLVLPPQLRGSIREPVLALRRFPIVFNLCGGGLADLNECEPPQMDSADFGMITHLGAPVQCVRRSRPER